MYVNGSVERRTGCRVLLTHSAHGHVHDEVEGLIERGAVVAAAPGVAPAAALPAAALPERLIELDTEQAVGVRVDIRVQLRGGPLHAEDVEAVVEGLASGQSVVGVCERPRVLTVAGTPESADSEAEREHGHSQQLQCILGL